MSRSAYQWASAGAVSALALASAFHAAAQTGPLIIDGRRIDRDQTTPAPEEEARDDGLRGRLSLDAAATAAAPAPLRAVVVHGSSLDSALLEAAWRAYVDQPLDDARITAIAQALSAVYRRSDIALFAISAPRQNLNDGELELIVAEGGVAEIEIVADRPEARDFDLVRRYGAALAGERPLRRRTLERYLSLIRDIPGESITAELQPAAQAGDVRLILNATRRSMAFGLSLNNRGTPRLGRTQLTGEAAFNGYLRAGDRTAFSLALPTGDDLFTYVSAAHATPIGAEGLRLQLNLSRLDTRPRGGAIEGRAIAGGVSLSYPLLRSYARNLTLSAGLDLLDSRNAILGQVFDTSQTRVLRTGAAFSDVRSARALSAGGSLSFGLDALGAEVNPGLASADFAKLTLQTSYSRVLREDFVVRLRAGAQVANAALPGSEQFALGGDAFGRAFASAVTQGDGGYGLSAEFAYRPRNGGPAWLRRGEGYVFVDGGEAFRRDRPLIAGADFGLSSGGGGVRFTLGGKTSLGLEFARAIEAPLAHLDDSWRFVYTLQARR